MYNKIVFLYQETREDDQMSWNSVRDYLSQFGAESRMIAFPVSSATVALAAQALKVEPARIAKTLTFRYQGGCVAIVAAGDARVDNSLFKAVFHEKAVMLTADQVEEMTGHAVGAVCPFALKAGVPVYLDESLRRFQTVFPAAGTSSSAIELSLEELFLFSGAKGWIHVSKGWQQTENEG